MGRCSGSLDIGAGTKTGYEVAGQKISKGKQRQPYGLTGGEPTDAFKLINYHTWSWEQLISRHVAVGLVCLVILLGFYLWGIKQASKMIVRKELADASALANAAQSPSITLPSGS